VKLSKSIVWPSELTDDRMIGKVIKVINTFYGEIRDLLDGRIELSRIVPNEPEGGGENMGFPITGTSGAVAGATFVVLHKLGRKPVYVWITPQHAIGTTATTFYWQSVDYTAWTDTSVTLRCTGASIGFRGWVV
jgi:hypothetical protein